MLVESHGIVQKFLEEERYGCLLYRPVFRDRPRMKVLPQCTPVVPPDLAVGEHAEGPLGTRAR